MVKEFIKGSYFKLAATLGKHKYAIGDSNLLILTYHRVLSSMDCRIRNEQPGMYVTPDTFSKNLEYLKDNFDVRKLSEWVEKLSKGEKLPKRCCSITFDDGWQDNYEYAFPLLMKYNVPATIFLVTDYIDSNKNYWPGRLTNLIECIIKLRENKLELFSSDLIKSINMESLAEKGGLHKENMDILINNYKNHTDEFINNEIDKAYSELKINEIITTRVILNKTEIKDMLASNLVELGSHTVNHTRLINGLSESVIYKQAVESKTIIENMFNISINLFCYPNGDYTDRSLKLVRDNYLGACTTMSGWNTNKSDIHLLKRISIHEDMAKENNRFLAKISGWL